MARIMTAPALRRYVDGTTAVTGDELNTFVQSCDTLADLRTFTGTAGIEVQVRGAAAANDGGQGMFYWDGNSVAADNNSTVIVPYGTNGGGAWIRQSLYTSFAPWISFLPTANPVTTYAAALFQGTSAFANAREFYVSVGFTVNTGSAASGAARDKVALYSGLTQQAGAGDCWSFNTVLTMAAGSGTAAAQGYELDFNNLNADRGNASAGAGFAAPVAYGMSITGAGNFKSTAALLFSGPGTAIWNRGIAIVNNSVSQASFQDLGSATTVFDIYGVHTYGLDMASAAITNPIRFANGGIIASRNAADTLNVPMLQLDASDVLRVGGVGVSSIGIYGNLIPSVDNFYTLGNATFRYSVVWAANGTIQTSDARLKRNIRALSSMSVTRDIVMGLRPVTYQWVSGGVEIVKEPETHEVQVVETVTWDDVEVTVEGGVAVQRPVTRTAKKDVWDEVEVFDEHGREVWVDVDAVPAVYDRRGRTVTPAKPASRIRKTHRVPRMETRTVMVPKQVQRPGRRTHWGLLADEVKDAFDRAGVDDFGGYVRGEDGTEGLRMDQLTPVLLQDHQDLVREVAQLRAELAQLRGERA
jgi:hypothetical protein